jgi:hypothetical protein
MPRLRSIVSIAVVAASLVALSGAPSFAADDVHAAYNAVDNPYEPGMNKFRGVAMIGVQAGISIEGDGAATVWQTNYTGTIPVLKQTPAFGWDIVRGIAVLADQTGGYVLDGWGGLHPFAIDGNSLPAAVTGNEYRAGQDWARGVALLPDGSGGYVVDGNGDAHPFSIGSGATPPALTGLPHWDWDIARGIVLQLGGGYVLDGWGGLHPFAREGESAPDPVTDAPYWLGWDIARSASVAAARTPGVVLDAWGGVHNFTIPGPLCGASDVVSAAC